MPFMFVLAYFILRRGKRCEFLWKECRGCNKPGCHPGSVARSSQSHLLKEGLKRNITRLGGVARGRGAQSKKECLFTFLFKGRQGAHVRSEPSL